MNLFRPPSGIAFGFDPFGNAPEVRQNTPDVRVLRQVSNGAFDVSIMTVGMTDPQLHAFGRSIFWHRPNECADLPALFRMFKRPNVRAEKLLFRIRSEEHTSELQSLMRISYAVFCL